MTLYDETKNNLIAKDEKIKFCFVHVGKAIYSLRCSYGYYDRFLEFAKKLEIPPKILANIEEGQQWVTPAFLEHVVNTLDDDASCFYPCFTGEVPEALTEHKAYAFNALTRQDDNKNTIQQEHEIFEGQKKAS